MRLLFVHDRFGAMAGAEVNIQLTAAELQARGHSLGLIHGVGTGKGEAAWNSIFAERFPYDERNGFSQTKGAIEAFQPDVVYVHKMADLNVLNALASSDAPVVRMVHDHDLYCMRSYRYSPFSRKICTRAAGWGCIFPCGAVLARDRNGTMPFKWVSYRTKQQELALNRRFDRMIVATGYMREELLRNGFESAQIEIHAPVPLTSHDATPASFSEHNRIIYSGQIIRGKGVDVLLESLARVRSPFECLIFGDGNHRPYCEELSRKLGLSDRVSFKGYLPSDEVDKFYSDASLAVVSSVWPEPFGAVGLEAMRHGLPVVAFDAGGIREWLHDGENGFLVPWMDRAAYAARVEQLLRDKALGRRLGERGRILAQEKFSFGRYIDGLEEMFARLTGKEALCSHG